MLWTGGWRRKRKQTRQQEGPRKFLWMVIANNPSKKEPQVATRKEGGRMVSKNTGCGSCTVNWMGLKTMVTQTQCTGVTQVCWNGESGMNFRSTGKQYLFGGDYTIRKGSVRRRKLGSFTGQTAYSFQKKWIQTKLWARRWNKDGNFIGKKYVNLH